MRKNFNQETKCIRELINNINHIELHIRIGIENAIVGDNFLTENSLKYKSHQPSFSPKGVF